MIDITKTEIEEIENAKDIVIDEFIYFSNVTTHNYIEVNREDLKYCLNFIQSIIASFQCHAKHEDEKSENERWLKILKTNGHMCILSPRSDDMGYRIYNFLIPAFHLIVAITLAERYESYILFNESLRDKPTSHHSFRESIQHIYKLYDNTPRYQINIKEV